MLSKHGSTISMHNWPHVLPHERKYGWSIHPSIHVCLCLSQTEQSHHCFTIITAIKADRQTFRTCFLVCLLCNLMLNLTKCVTCMFLTSLNEEEFFLFFSVGQSFPPGHYFTQCWIICLWSETDADIKKLLTWLRANAAAESCKPSIAMETSQWK